MNIPVTQRSARVGNISVMQSESGLSMVHILTLSPDLCPVSHNPISGSIRITYTTTGLVAEVVTLLSLLRAVERDSRSVEEIPSKVASTLVTALGVPVRCTLSATINPGPQAIEVKCEVLPRHAHA